MKFRLLLPTILFAFLATLSPAKADLPDYVVKLDMGDAGGSAVLIGNGFALTAEHCAVKEEAWVSQPGSARNVHEPVKNGIDEARLIQVDVNETQPACKIGDTPAIGDTVTGVGYPGGKPWSQSGKVLGIDRDYIYCDFMASPGASGGGLFNAAGELVGICSAYDPSTGHSLWIHTDSLKAAVQFTQQKYDRQQLQRVVALCANPCGPCDHLKRDIAAGKFPGFEFEFATFDYKLGAWDNPALPAEFRKECNYHQTDMAAPVIWIPGTGKYREGYDTTPGLIGFLESVVKFIFTGPPRRVPMGVRVAADTKVNDSLLGEIASLKSELTNLRGDYDTFKDSGVIGKVKAIAALKEDKAQIEATLGSLKERVHQAREDPVGTLLKLMAGIFTGVLHGLLPISSKEVMA